MGKIVKNRSDAEMFDGWTEPEVPRATFQPSAESKKREKKETIESHLPDSVRIEMERQLMEIKLDLFKRGISDISYLLQKEGDSIRISLTPKAKIK